MSRPIPKDAIGLNMEGRSSLRARGTSPTGRTSKHFEKQKEFKPIPIGVPPMYPPPTSTYGGTSEKAGMNGKQKKKGNQSPFTVGPPSNSKNKAKKPASTLTPVAQTQFYTNSSSNTASSRRNLTPIPSPSNGPSNLADEAAITGQEFIEVDGESDDDIESPEVTHLSSVGPINRTSTGTAENRATNGTEKTKTASTKASIFTGRDAAGPSSPQTKKVKTMLPRPVASKNGLVVPSYIGLSPRDTFHPIKSVIIDNHVLPPEEVNNRLVLKVAHMGFQYLVLGKPEVAERLALQWFASKSGGPVTGLMIDCEASQKVRTDWYEEFASIHDEVLETGRSRFILLVELGEPIVMENSKLLKALGDLKPQVVMSNQVLRTAYKAQIQSFVKVPSPTPKLSAKQLSGAVLPTRPTPKRRAKQDQPETSDRESTRPTRTQPDRGARTAAAAAAPREPPTKKKPLPKNPDEIMREWPSNGRSEVNITNGDFYRLEEAEYLNDTLIEFGLKYNWAGLSEDKAETPQQFAREDIHIFNSFFYKKLSVRNRPSLKEANPDTPSWPAYETVRKWTRKVDVFSKRMLVIPINENLHWYLAVILNPGAILRKKWRNGSEDGADEPADQKDATLSEELEKDRQQEILNQANAMANQANGSGNLENASAWKSDRNSDDGEDPLNVIDEDSTNVIDKRDENADHAEEPEIVELLPEQESDSEKVEKITTDSPAPSAQSTETIPPVTYQPVSLVPPESVPLPSGTSTRRGPIPPPAAKAPKTEFDENEPVIMTFDSLGGSHQPVAKVLNKWLVYEALDKAKEKTTLEETNWDLHFPAAYKAIRVPGQDNFADCGVYVLHYAIELMKDKGALREYIFEKSTVKSDKEKEKNKDLWNAHEMSNQREVWKTLIRSLPSEKDDAAEGTPRKETVTVAVENKEEDSVHEVSNDDIEPQPREFSAHEMQQSRESSELSEHPPAIRRPRQSTDSLAEELSRAVDSQDYDFVTSMPSPHQERPTSEISLGKRSIPISPTALEDGPYNKRRRIEMPVAEDPDVVADSQADESPLTANQPMDIDQLALHEAQEIGSPDISTVLNDILSAERNSHIFMSESAVASSVTGLQDLTNGIRDVQVTSGGPSVMQSKSGRPSMESSQAPNQTSTIRAVGTDIVIHEATGSSRQENIQMQLRHDHDAEPRKEYPIRSSMHPSAKDVRVFTVHKGKRQRHGLQQTRPAVLEDIGCHLEMIQPALSIDQAMPTQTELLEIWYQPWREGMNTGGAALDRVLSHSARAAQGEDGLFQGANLPLQSNGVQHDGVSNGKNGHAAVVDVSSGEEV
ncbi:hypothetical protein QFC21_003053 [Naganishia friedmannii]|uniref:Uncharacterized protein n=1 Tax=Naganishia friedmannii TaxID=89922 RepID=A0ACC2VRT5_9TREE|nr:hypothetical protein QFC21_003053 [Naganishia friedmannii]